MRLPVAVTMLVVGLALGFAVTASPSWISIGLLGTSLVIAGAGGLLVAVLGRISRARRERWHAAGPWLLAVGGTLWLAVHPVYVEGIDLVNLGFIIAVSGLVSTALATYLVSPWRGRGVLKSWLTPVQPPDDDRTMMIRPPPEDRHR